MRRPWSAAQGYTTLRGLGLPTRRSVASLGTAALCATFLSALGLIWLAHSPNSPLKDTRHIQLPHQHAHGALLPSVPTAQAASGGTQQQQAPVPRLDYPLWWHAPFVAQSGLGTEAIMIIEALISTRQMRAEDIYITHSGDTFDPDVLKGMSRETRNLLAHRQHPQQVADEWIDVLFPGQRQTQLARLRDMTDQRRVIAVCMNWFDCWRRAGEMPSNMPGCPCPLGLNRTAFTIARTMFETAGLPAHLAEHVKAMDEVWVPTQFNKDSFAAAGVDPAKIRIVPEGIDTAFWDPARHLPVNLSTLGLAQATGPAAGPNTSLPEQQAAAAPAGSVPPKPFVFLAVFKWEARKGWKDLVTGFCDAFSPADPVELWILARPFMDSGNDFDAKVRAYARQAYNLTDDQVSARLPRIYTSSVLLSEADFVRTYRAVDALAIPTHGEGWGRPQIEAMAMGLPVITTNWSGPTAFINDAIAYPLVVERLATVTSDGDPNFFQAFIGQKWAQPSVAHLTQLLRHVASHPAEAAAKGAAARRHVAAHFTPREVAGVVAGEVRRLQRLLRERDAAAAAATARPWRRQRGSSSSSSSSSGGRLARGGGLLGKKGLFTRLGGGSSSGGSSGGGGGSRQQQQKGGSAGAAQPQ